MNTVEIYDSESAPMRAGLVSRLRDRGRRFVPKETLVMAFDNVRGHKFRSFLTVLGIVIGVVVVIVIASILTGMRDNMVQFIEEYGTNNIFAFHLTTGPSLGPRDRSEWSRKPLKPEDGKAIREQASTVDDVANLGFVWGMDRTISYQGFNYKQAEINAVSPNYGRITNLMVQEGRFINESDEEHRRNVMVIGVNVADAMFPHKSIVSGTEVRLGGRPFEVIGVLEKRKGGFLGENEDDNVVLIPYGTGRKIAPRNDFLMLVIRAKPGKIRQALEQVEGVLRRQRGVKYKDPNNFDLNTADRFIEQFDKITAAVGLIAIAISGVGLLVGGIGVMNIMLVSVTERTHEIGIRKAIGARRKDIVHQFLFEAMMLTFMGGILGVLLAILISRIIIFFLPDLPASIPMWAVITGLVVSIAVGLVFGVWPARKASRLDPIEALRYE
jgi:putative ABC transport system permease protein